MAVVGIIAEYNPFHRGHAWQIAEIRSRLGEDTCVVVAMSGNFVQRGDFAVFSKHARAEMALAGDADLVIELPTPWSSATAEKFAQGGVALLSATGVVTHLAFGCESGDAVPLERTASALESEGYSEQLRRYLAEGMSFAAARQMAVSEYAGEAASCLSLPNNALAVEYLRALKKTGGSIQPLALPRVGSAHDSDELTEFSSASAIRSVLLSGGDWKSFVSTESAAIMQREIDEGRAPVTLRNCERAILARLRCMCEEEFLPYDGGGEGLYRRFYRAVHSAVCVDDILTAAKTKRYPLARLRRMLLHSYLGVTPAEQGETPSYLRVLGANERGRKLLGQMRKSALLPIVTKPGQVRYLDNAVQDQFLREAACTDLYTLAMPDMRNAVPDSEFTCAAVMTGLDTERRSL